MVPTSRKVTVGIFVLIALVVFTYMIFMVGSDKGAFAPTHVVYATFKQIRGLTSGAVVHLAGIHAGTVEDISFYQNEEGLQIRLTLRMFERYFDLLRQDSVATIATQGVLGDKYVQITLGDQSKPRLEPGSYIRTEEITTFLDELGQGGGTLEHIDMILRDINQVLSELLYDENIKKSMSNIADVTAELKTAAERLQMMDTPFGQLTDRSDDNPLNVSIQNIRDTTSSLASVARKVDDGEGTIGALINDPTLYEDIKVLVGGARRNALIRFVVRESLKRADR